MGAKEQVRFPEMFRRWFNNKRVSAAERQYGWLRGKSSGGRNPMGGCGVK
jgi:hypothetical protein